MDRVQGDAAGGIASSEERSAVPRESHRPSHLLIAEDDRTLREGLRLALESEGYHVRAVASGQDALAALAGSRFDIVITDLHLSPVTGLDVLRAASSMRPPARVIVMTGDASLENGLAVIRAGACDCLAKPFSATRLRSLLARAEQMPATPAASDSVLSEFERVYVRRLVQDAGGNLERAARMACVDRGTLERLIDEHDVAPPP